MIFCTLKSDDYMHISKFKIDKEIWKIYSVPNDGNNEVKQSRIEIILHYYKFIYILLHEYITDMCTHHLFECFM